MKEADIVIFSYQDGALDKFDMGEAGIRQLNPSVIYGSLVCFSDTVWRNRPGWAPCAEDITGLSVRNGSLEDPVNLNGVPLDYSGTGNRCKKYGYLIWQHAFYRW